MPIPPEHDAFRDHMYGHSGDIARLLSLGDERATDLLVELCEASLEASELAQAAHDACILMTKGSANLVPLAAWLLTTSSRLDTLAHRLRAASPAVQELLDAATEAIKETNQLSEKAASQLIWDCLTQEGGPPPA